MLLLHNDSAIVNKLVYLSNCSGKISTLGECRADDTTCIRIWVIFMNQKGEKRGHDEYGIVLILEQNIRVFLGLHKLTHGLTFGIIYFCKYYGQ